jgi:SepF-like predicted cell division protein (DUF552 family)
MISFFKKKKNEEERNNMISEVEFDEFVEIDVDNVNNEEILYYVKPLVISEYLDIKPALKYIREGNYILLINLKPLKTRDTVELKRVIAKLKQTAESMNGDIIGFGKGEWVLIVPPGIKIERESKEEQEENNESEQI